MPITYNRVFLSAEKKGKESMKRKADRRGKENRGWAREEPFLTSKGMNTSLSSAKYLKLNTKTQLPRREEGDS